MREPIEVRILPEEGEGAKVLLRLAIIAGVAMLPYVLTSQKFQITVKAWWARVKMETAGAVDAERTGFELVSKAVDWSRSDRAAVVTEAERITKEGATS